MASGLKGVAATIAKSLLLGIDLNWRIFRKIGWLVNQKSTAVAHFTQHELTYGGCRGVGDGGGLGAKKYFSGNYYVKFGHFSGKNHVKFGNFVNFSGMNHVKFGHVVNFSYIFFGQKCRAPLKLSELLRLWVGGCIVVSVVMQNVICRLYHSMLRSKCNLFSWPVLCAKRLHVCFVRCFFFKFCAIFAFIVLSILFNALGTLWLHFAMSCICVVFCLHV